VKRGKTHTLVYTLIMNIETRFHYCYI